MDKGTIMKVASAVVGLGLVGFGAWLTASEEAEHSSLLIWAGLGLIGGGLGTAALPSAIPGRRPPPAEPPLSRTRRGTTPPLPVLLALALVMGLASGCGASVYRTHSTAIVTVASLHSVAYAARDAARDAALDAVEAEHPAHGDERTAALRAEDARWRPSGAALDGMRAALGVWVEALDAAHRSELGESDLIALLTPVAARVVQLTQAVIEGLRVLGVEGVPDVPPLVMALARAAVGS